MPQSLLLRAVFLSTVLTLVAHAGCYRSIERQFEKEGYLFPLHIDRRIGRAEFGLGGGGRGKGGPACTAAPEVRTFLQDGIASLEPSDLEPFLKERCSRALAYRVHSPFAIRTSRFAAHSERSPAVPLDYLAVHVECYGTGDPAPGIALSEARGGASAGMPPRRPSVEKALDGWPLELGYEADQWRMWNVAMLDLRGGRPVFVGFVKRFDPHEEAQMMIPEYHDQLLGLSACGRVHEAAHRSQ